MRKLDTNRQWENDIEARRIKKIVRAGHQRMLDEEHRASAFDGVPAGHSRRGAITTQKVLTYALSKVRLIPGYVTLPQLAAERGIQAQLARLRLKAADVRKPGDRWTWKEDSKALKSVRKVLGLT